MGTKTVKISDNNYRKICEYAGELQRELGEPVSIDRTLTHLLNPTTLSELAGAWNMSDKEAEDFMKTLKKGWKQWKTNSV